MKNIIRKILKEEFGRDWIDSEYADEYPKYKGMIINAIKMDLIASGQSENKIMLFDSDKKGCIL
jgi:5S rRNA maturation endonuclease (ribonuclease M5)